MSPHILLEEMSWPEVSRAAKRGKLVLVPVGSIEQHGPHLPLNCDTVAALEVSLRVARRIGAVVAPPISPGVSTQHMLFPGTITLKPSTFVTVVKEYCASLARAGFKDIALVNGHGGNTSSLSIASSEARLDLDVNVYLVTWFEFIPKELGAAMSYETGFHANGPETSWMLALRPNDVRMDLAKKEMPAVGKEVRASFNLFNSSFKTFKDLTRSGVLGDPTTASAAKGKRYVDSAVLAISSALVELTSSKRAQEDISSFGARKRRS